MQTKTYILALSWYFKPLVVISRNYFPTGQTCGFGEFKLLCISNWLIIKKGNTWRAMTTIHLCWWFTWFHNAGLINTITQIFSSFIAIIRLTQYFVAQYSEYITTLFMISSRTIIFELVSAVLYIPDELHFSINDSDCRTYWRLNDSLHFSILQPILHKPSFYSGLLEQMGFLITVSV